MITIDTAATLAIDCARRILAAHASIAMADDTSAKRFIAMVADTIASLAGDLVSDR